MRFIDRKREIERLQRALSANRKRLIVIYGRRRMGKSALLRQVLRPNDIYFEAEMTDTAIQLQLLARSIASLYPGFDTPRYENWEALLVNFNLVCAEGSALILDEFPYMVKASPHLPSLLQRLIDNGNLRYHMVICGSSQRMMRNMILGPSEPLYGRADEKINLGPIAPRHWQELFGLTSTEIVKEYAVWGGVPRYWLLREDYGSLSEAIREMVLDPHGVLNLEPRALFFDEADIVTPFLSIMMALGDGHTRYSRLADKLQRKTSDLAQPLNTLVDMDYVQREVPFGENPDKSRKTLYRILDPFMAFYFRFVAPNRSFLAMGKIDRVEQRISEQLNTHVGNCWEAICRHAVSGSDLCGYEWEMASRWWGSVPIYKPGYKTPVSSEELEFDVMASDITGKALLIGECKWAEADFADRQYRKLKEKARHLPFISHYDNIVYALFVKESPRGEIPSDCRVFNPYEILPLLD